MPLSSLNVTVYVVSHFAVNVTVFSVSPSATLNGSSKSYSLPLSVTHVNVKPSFSHAGATTVVPDFITFVTVSFASAAPSASVKITVT